MRFAKAEPVSDSSPRASLLRRSGGSYVADPNRALFESVVDLLAPVLDELVFVGGCTTGHLRHRSKRSRLYSVGASIACRESRLHRGAPGIPTSRCSESGAATNSGRAASSVGRDRVILSSAIFNGNDD